MILKYFKWKILQKRTKKMFDKLAPKVENTVEKIATRRKSFIYWLRHDLCQFIFHGILFVGRVCRIYKLAARNQWRNNHRRGGAS